MIIRQKIVISSDIIELFHNHLYERYVLSIMNNSKCVFPGVYEEVVEQSDGECDFIEKKTNIKFDAKLPFQTNQLKILAKGKKYEPDIIKWLGILNDEATDFDPLAIRNNHNYDIADTKLYQIMKKEIIRDKIDENIVFFLPYPVVLSVRGCDILQRCGDYLQAIFLRLKEDIELHEREIYIIYPSVEKNIFALRQFGKYSIEFVYCDDMEKYFWYDVVLS